MKQLITIAAILLANHLVFAQSKQTAQLVSIAKTYSSFMFTNDADKQTLAGLKEMETPELQATLAFIQQCITKKNKLLTPEFLTVPNDQTLKQIHLIMGIHQNLKADNPRPNEAYADSLLQLNPSRFELIDTYYGVLFIAVGNKNQPFNLAKINFEPEKYNLTNETEKGIFYLRCMDLCGTMIWGYMNIAKPPNTAEVLKTIKKYPKINGQPYYVYHDFFFDDFELEMENGKGPESYKSYYLNKLYETVLSHVICLIQEEASEEEINKVLLGSILPDERLYQYTELKETLESIFTEVEED